MADTEDKTEAVEVPETPETPEALETGDQGRILGLITAATPEQRASAFESIVDAALPSFSYYLMVVVSGTVAAFGLLSNSTAVVIGAMLIAPLMGPILGTALGLAVDDRSLLKTSLKAELLGVLGCILIGFLVGSIPFKMEYGSEIIGRTSPTIFDLIVAVFSGLAGAYAYFDKKISPALPGVAIAVSLVPPLAACGLCLATGQYGWASGAFMLFLANFLAIQLAASLILTSFKMDTVHPKAEKLSFWKRYGVSVGCLLVVGIFLTHTLVTLVRESRYKERVNRLVDQHLSSGIGANLHSLRIESDMAGNKSIVTVVMTPTELGAESVAALEDFLEKELEEPIDLAVRSLITKDFSRTGPVYNLNKEGVDQQGSQEDSESAFLGAVSTTLSEYLAHFPGVEVIDVKRLVAEPDGPVPFAVAVRTPKIIEPRQVANLEKAVKDATGKEIRLEVRSVATQSADATGYRFQPYQDESVTNVEKQAQIRGLVEKHLKKTTTGTTLMNVVYRERDNGEVVVLAIVKSPKTLEPNQVAAIERQLKQEVDSRAVLVVRSLISAETTSNGYLESFDDSKLFEQGLRADEGLQETPESSPSPSASPEG